MSEKPMKRKRRKLSSSSSDEDDKASKGQNANKRHKSAKRRHNYHSEKRSATKHEDSAVKEDSHTRQTKNTAYRHSKSKSDQKPVTEDKERSKKAAKHEHDRSSKSKSDVLGGRHISGYKAKEHQPSQSQSISTVGTAPRREEKIRFSITSREKSLHRSSSRSKKQLSPSLKVKEVKRTCKDTDPSRQQHNDSSTSRTSSTSEARQRRLEMVKKMCQRLQEHEFKEKGSFNREAKMASSIRQSSASVRNTTSECGSHLWKAVTSAPGNEASRQTAMPSPSQQQTCSPLPPVPLTFKIPKKRPLQPAKTSTESNAAIYSNPTVKPDSGLSDSVAHSSTQALSRAEVATVAPFEKKDAGSCSSGHLSASCAADTVPLCDQSHVADELHLARSEKRLEVNVMQSYGELTCMDIDSPEEGATDSQCKQPPQQDSILVLDTNILLSHLDYVKKMRSHGLGAFGFPIVLIPWVVLQELDSLKKGRGLSGSVAHLACPAISYIYNCLKSRDPYLWGQSMQQAADSNNGLNPENNDDKVLQCCLQYQSLYPGCALILCTNDKNLCNKALLSGVTAYSQLDLEGTVKRSTHGVHLQQNLHTPRRPQIRPHPPALMPSRTCPPVPPHSQQTTGLSVGATEKGSKRPVERRDEEEICATCFGELRDCLQEALSDVLEKEMRAVYEDLWLEIVYLKPPWTLQDVLKCLKKHWIAVFGSVVPRKLLQTVLHLTDFFNSGESWDCSTIVAALQEGKELVEAFGKRSGCVPRALAIMDSIVQKLQPQEESPVSDVVMNDVDEDEPPTPASVSHLEVWSLFENIWSTVFQMSLEVFKALGFDPHTMQSALPEGGPPPPQDAVACLDQLTSMLSQLLQAFSSVLSSAPGLEEVRTLLSVIQAHKIADVDPRVRDTDLLRCFSQQDFRERLRVGGSQLLQLKEALDRCVQSTGQHIARNT